MYKEDNSVAPEKEEKLTASKIGLGGGADSITDEIQACGSCKSAFDSKYMKYDPFISIIGIGGGAGRIVDKIQTCGFCDILLSAFGMNGQEMEKLSLPNKFLIGTDGLGSGKDRNYARSECIKTVHDLDSVINKHLSCFVVCLGGGTGEGCIKTFLHKATEMKTQLKLLVVTLPHSSEGVEKRKNAISLLNSLEELVDGIYVIDYDSLPYNTISEVFEEGSRRAFEFVSVLIGSIRKHGKIDFGYYDIYDFLKSDSATKYVEYFSLSGNVSYLKHELKDLHKYLTAKYSSMNDISNMILLATYNEDTDENKVKCFLQEILQGIMQSLNDESNVKWGLYHNRTMEEDIYRLALFVKCN